MANLELNEMLAAELAARAAAEGLTIQGYLESVVLQRSHQSPAPISQEEFEQLLDEEASDGHSPTGTFSRCEIYNDHD